MKSSSYRYFVIALLILFSGCSSVSRFHSTSSPKANFSPPPGVDSLVALQADSLSQLFFVNDAQQREANVYFNKSRAFFTIADSLWSAYQKLLDTNCTRTQNDSDAVIDYCDRGSALLTNYAYNRILPPMPFHGIKKITSLCIELNENAMRCAEKALLLDPFNINVRLHLSQIYTRLADLTDDDHYYRSAIKEMQQFLIHEKSMYEVYVLLAECYYALGQWADAYQNFYQAQVVLEKTSHFQDASAAMDTSKLIVLLQKQADTKAKMYDSHSALELLHKAHSATHSPQKEQELDNYVKWINWDDGNIRAAEQRDTILKLYDEKKYKKAKTEFKKLLKILHTERTKNIINWKIATIDFQLLNNKKEGIARLFRVIKNITRADADSANNVFIADYGAMCYSMGVDYIQQKNHQCAYTYFKQAANIDWSERGKCFFQLARLSQNNPSETINSCQQALRFRRQLMPDLVEELYSLLVQAYMSSGDFILARTYFRKLNP